MICHKCRDPYEDELRLCVIANDRINGNIGVLSPIPIGLPNSWTAYVEMPLTDSELEKLLKGYSRDVIKLFTKTRIRKQIINVSG